MDYERQYKDALERAETLIDKLESNHIKGFIYHIFPELLESKDERIKREIIAYINELADLKNEKIPTKWLDWLEKQGEPIRTDIEIPFGANDSELQEVSYNIPEGFYAEIKDDRVVIKKAKFKVGDWITTTDEEGNVTTEKIIEFWGDKVRLIGTNGFYTLWPKHELNYYHIWTINDANDGDVLVTAKPRNCPFIYRKTDYNNNLAYYYAGIDGNDDFQEGCIKRTLFHFGSVSNVVPATKEQRDLLFQKMKESGWEWDAEKKELKKIETQGNQVISEIIKTKRRCLVNLQNWFMKIFGI